MSNTCGNCDCADKTQCVKKGNSYGFDIVETEKSYYDNVVSGFPMTENDGKCNCGPNCKCTTCTCGH
ncbi:Metallothionein-like protein [Thalictrum thalictroides]|uniref:Metallothionein-like protein n=1 Tax=Thalictrum thalictroides TaxID=46969 RepID=A0A7J6WQ75_THATH|nr:Metallothionein-like protein [Thalictrum thalictroides]